MTIDILQLLNVGGKMTNSGTCIIKALSRRRLKSGMHAGDRGRKEERGFSAEQLLGR